MPRLLVSGFKFPETDRLSGRKWKYVTAPLSSFFFEGIEMNGPARVWEPPHLPLISLITSSFLSSLSLISDTIIDDGISNSRTTIPDNASFTVI